MNYREILEDFVNNEDTIYCYDWQGFNHKIILPCIEQLLKNENNLQSKIDKANKILDKHFQDDEGIVYKITGEYVAERNEKFIEELRDILKEKNNE